MELRNDLAALRNDHFEQNAKAKSPQGRRGKFAARGKDPSGKEINHARCFVDPRKAVHVHAGAAVTERWVVIFRCGVDVDNLTRNAGRGWLPHTHAVGIVHEIIAGCDGFGHFVARSCQNTWIEAVQGVSFIDIRRSLFVVGDIQTTDPTKEVGGIVARTCVGNMLHATARWCHSIHLVGALLFESTAVLLVFIMLDDSRSTTNGNHFLSILIMTIFTTFLSGENHVLLHVAKGSVGRRLDDGTLWNQVHHSIPRSFRSCFHLYCMTSGFQWIHALSCCCCCLQPVFGTSTEHEYDGIGSKCSTGCPTLRVLKIKRFICGTAVVVVMLMIMLTIHGRKKG
mmetsp:Transcript_17015/g.28252  ORF Transcript_17015/g.28252 Transcript_17015/m.28252 type:complete len:340 (-) Transcript_17015:545-1564(-)